MEPHILEILIMCDSVGYLLIDDDNGSYFLMEMGNVEIGKCYIQGCVACDV